MPRGDQRESSDFERTKAIAARYKRRIAAGDKSAEIIADLADEYGVLRPAIRRQIHKGLSPAFAALVNEQGKSAPSLDDQDEEEDGGMIEVAYRWCAQCDKRVSMSRAASCGSPFCKARDLAA